MSAVINNRAIKRCVLNEMLYKLAQTKHESDLKTKQAINDVVNKTQQLFCQTMRQK